MKNRAKFRTTTGGAGKCTAIFTIAIKRQVKVMVGGDRINIDL